MRLVLFVASSLLLYLATLQEAYAENQSSNQGIRSPELKEWPCPNAEDIEPCICTTDDTTYEIFIDCSSVASDDELQRVFSANIPLEHIYSFTILDNANIRVLNSTSFGPAYFSTVSITGTSLIEVQDGTFAKSHEYLEILDLSNNALQIFPFELNSEYTVLRTLNLSANRIPTAQNLESNSLVTMDFSSNPGFQIDSTLFGDCPALTDVFIRNCGITDLGIGIFDHLDAIRTIDLNSNDIGTLRIDSIRSSGSTLTSVIFDNNPITTVEPGFLTGVDPTASISLVNCSLVEITDAVWSYLIETLGSESVDLSDNPLRCGCDLEWLFGDDDLYSKFTASTACSDGYPLYDVPPGIFPVHC